MISKGECACTHPVIEPLGERARMYIDASEGDLEYLGSGRLQAAQRLFMTPTAGRRMMRRDSGNLVSDFVGSS